MYLKSQAIVLTAACAMSAAVNVGDMAPDFSLQTREGSTFKLSDHQGEVSAIFFLGCT